MDLRFNLRHKLNPNHSLSLLNKHPLNRYLLKTPLKSRTQRKILILKLLSSQKMFN